MPTPEGIVIGDPAEDVHQFFPALNVLDGRTAPEVSPAVRLWHAAGPFLLSLFFFAGGFWCIGSGWMAMIARRFWRGLILLALAPVCAALSVSFGLHALNIAFPL